MEIDIELVRRLELDLPERVLRPRQLLEIISALLHHLILFQIVRIGFDLAGNLGLAGGGELFEHLEALAHSTVLIRTTENRL